MLQRVIKNVLRVNKVSAAVYNGRQVKEALSQKCKKMSYADAILLYDAGNDSEQQCGTRATAVNTLMDDDTLRNAGCIIPCARTLTCYLEKPSCKMQISVLWVWWRTKAMSH
jgi:hypothetical protein